MDDWSNILESPSGMLLGMTKANTWRHIGNVARSEAAKLIVARELKDGALPPGEEGSAPCQDHVGGMIRQPAPDRDAREEDIEFVPGNRYAVSAALVPHIGAVLAG